MSIHRLVLIAGAALLAAGCATTQTPVSVADTIAHDPELSTLNGLVQKAGLADTLKSGGPYTVFAPTNEAFQAVPAKTLDELGKDPARLKAVLSYHVLPTRLTADQVSTSNAKTTEGGNLALAKAGAYLTVEDAMVQTADIAASNGVVHTIDRVLMPPRR
ncbi:MULTISPECIES: fasciclin domain-containing protein [Ramlibacter]|uniref:Fasciclin domain-containing protein n=1 Tax=Ramlibacter pinisoli TaxID=2682844 RepID=A0A6N8IW82_9BURK|nr:MULTISPECIES: fasciclin domain-containing protein [Ramlibacter]MBA2961280.1 fasciclin domain-containing protein [Ramlibacter sp. CGMCC 1.13660]MVQ31224.1 fasciclin domain-containing protein [Ramlibacter pinisoli]